MYCPKCAEPNADDTKFCRACGENLTVVAQAMSKHLPVVLVSKLDEYLERKDERIRRDSIITGVGGILFLINGILQLVFTSGDWFLAIFLFFCALVMFAASMWDMLAFKRISSRNINGENSLSTANTAELESNSPPQISPSSVTENTTRHLDRVRQRPEEKV